MHVYGGLVICLTRLADQEALENLPTHSDAEGVGSTLTLAVCYVFTKVLQIKEPHVLMFMWLPVY